MVAARRAAVRPALRAVPTVVLAEIGKSLRGAWAARLGIAFEVPLFAIGYFVILTFMGRGRIQQEMLAPVLIGVVAIIFFHQQVTRMFWGVLGEMQAGTLEQLHLSPVPFAALLAGRQLSILVEAFAVTAFLGVLLVVPAQLVWGMDLPGGVAALQLAVPIGSMIVGGAGAALVVVGLTLVFRRMELFVEVLFATAYVLSGAAVPLDEMPAWIAVAGRLLQPAAQPIAYARAIILDGQTLAGAPVTWGLGWLLGQPLLLVVAGVVALALGQRIARRRGALGRY